LFIWVLNLIFLWAGFILIHVFQSANSIAIKTPATELDDVKLFRKYK
jgi:hypothetical protein